MPQRQREGVFEDAERMVSEGTSDWLTNIVGPLLQSNGIPPEHFEENLRWLTPPGSRNYTIEAWMRLLEDEKTGQEIYLKVGEAFDKACEHIGKALRAAEDHEVPLFFRLHLNAVCGARTNRLAFRLIDHFKDSPLLTLEIIN